MRALVTWADRIITMDRITEGPISIAKVIYYSIILNISVQTGCACNDKYFSPSDKGGGPLVHYRQGSAHTLLHKGLGHSRPNPNACPSVCQKNKTLIFCPSPSGLSCVKQQHRYEAVKPPSSDLQSLFAFSHPSFLKSGQKKATKLLSAKKPRLNSWEKWQQK